MFRSYLRSAKLAPVLSEKENKALQRAVGASIRERRLARSLTQAELSEKTGISTKHLSRLERASGTNVSLETLTSIAKVLECSLAVLIDGSQIQTDSRLQRLIGLFENLNPRQFDVLIATADLFLEVPHVHLSRKLPHTKKNRTHRTIAKLKGSKK